MKIPNMTFWTNLVCAVAAVGSQVMADPSIMGILPPRAAHAVTAIAMAAMWYRSHRNIFVNADGSQAGQVPAKKGK